LVEPQAHGDTAKPVPFVGRFTSQAPAVKERLPVLAKKLIWTGLSPYARHFCWLDEFLLESGTQMYIELIENSRTGVDKGVPITNRDWLAWWLATPQLPKNRRFGTYRRLAGDWFHHAR
jgi:hypothetical protein